MKALNLLLTILIVLISCIAINAENIAVLKSYKGNVIITKHSNNKEIKPKINIKLDEKDIIKTGKNGEVQIKLKSGHLYKIGSNKKVKVAAIVKKIKSMKINKSTALSKLKLLRSKLRGIRKIQMPPLLLLVSGAKIWLNSRDQLINHLKNLKRILNNISLKYKSDFIKIYII